TKGTIHCGGSGLEAVPEAMLTDDIPATGPILRASKKKVPTEPVGSRVSQKGEVEAERAHARNFLDCVKSRKATNCPIEVGHKSTTTTLIALLAGDRKRYLKWDGERERFTNDDQANKLLSYEYREPWKLPEIA